MRIPLLLFVAAAALLPLDGSIAQYVAATPLPPDLRSFFERIETFGHGCGVAVLLVGVWCVDPARRRFLPRLVAASFGSGLAANIVKLIVARARPYHWLSQIGDELPNQFVGWFPLGFSGSHLQSFPSAHTATAVGLALGLSSIYPQGSKFFATMATLVALQRVVVGAHFAGDVLAAAGLAWLVARGLLRLPKIAAALDRWENGAASDRRETTPRKAA